MFVWMMISLFLLFVSSKQFRRESKKILNKTGRSVWVIMRLASKRTSQDMPLLTPLFMFLPGVVLGIAEQSILFFIVGCFYGVLILAIIPILFPMPSTLIKQ